ncbi:MAG: hypothetical protein A2X36_17145 [Elusimicrobia bacterium GWA2_69_24]|nr:MAG: hypothetical protein A2X36_17145 [Elusimicrobia bacterium GWA2_69_24]HBL17738.1 hypothetical protein [Elusimicrobiota bacterium]
MRLPRILLTFLALGAVSLQWAQWSVHPQRSVVESRVGSAEAFFHGMPDPGISLAMPLSAVLEALAGAHAPPLLRRYGPRLVMAASLILVYCLGRLLFGGLCGVLALLVCAVLGLIWFVDSQEHVAYVLLLLLTAVFAAWRGRAPSPLRSAGLGLAIGVSLLVRSPLALYPLVLSLYDWLAWRGRPARERWANLLPLWILPALLLSPWVHMNRVVHREFIPLEKGRAELGLAAGALGVVPGMDVDRLRDGLQLPPGSGIVSWAAGEVVRHPGRFVAACAARTGLAMSEHWVLLFLFLAAAWLFRGREDVRQTALLAAYFVAVHVPVGFVGRYLAPVWPIMAVLGTGLVSRLWDSPSRPAEARASVAFAALLLAAAAGLGLYADALAWSYPLRLDGSMRGLSAALKRHPEDPWLWSERGRRLMGLGLPSDAEAAFARALSLDPGPERKRDHAWALIAGGHERAAEPGQDLLLEALRLLSLGREDDAALVFNRARSLSAAASCHVGLMRTEREAALRQRFCSEDGGASEALWGLSAGLPFGRRAAVLERLGRVPGVDAEVRLRAARFLAETGKTRAAAAILETLSRDAVRKDEARAWLARVLSMEGRGEAALRLLRENGAVLPFRFWAAFSAAARGQGQKAVALAALDRSGGINADPESRVLPLLYAGLGAKPQAAELLARSLLDGPEAAAPWLWIETAAAARLLGDSAAERTALERAGPRPWNAADLEPMLAFFQSIGDPGGALPGLDILAEKYPSADGWAALASAAANAGKASRAREAAAAGLALGPSPELKLRFALLLQRAGDCRSAVAALGSLTEVPGTAAAALRARGICRHLAGAAADAVADLRLAVAAAPEELSSYLTLAAIHESRRRYGEALAVYDAGLALEPSDADLGLSLQLRSSRDELCARRSGLCP